MPVLNNGDYGDTEVGWVYSVGGIAAHYANPGCNVT